MTRTGISALAYFGALAVLLSACDWSGIENSSPRAVVESLHKASMNGDVEKIAGLAEPTQQEAIKAIAATTQELMAAKESFRRVVEDKIGAEQAKLVGDGQSMNSPFSKVVKEDGSLDWSKIKITEDGDKAIIEIDGRVYHDRLIKIGSRWYINSGDGKSPEEMMKDANEVRDQANKMIAVMTKLEEGIRSGKITKTNFEGEYFGEVLKAVMGG